MLHGKDKATSPSRLDQYWQAFTVGATRAALNPFYLWSENLRSQWVIDMMRGNPRRTILQTTRDINCWKTVMLQSWRAQLANAAGREWCYRYWLFNWHANNDLGVGTHPQIAAISAATAAGDSLFNGATSQLVEEEARTVRYKVEFQPQTREIIRKLCTRGGPTLASAYVHSFAFWAAALEGREFTNKYMSGYSQPAQIGVVATITAVSANGADNLRKFCATTDLSTKEAFKTFFSKDLPTRMACGTGCYFMQVLITAGLLKLSTMRNTSQENHR